MALKEKPAISEIICYNLKKIYRLAGAPLRTLPDFLIIGAAKSGTTSLYNYLIQHPNVMACFKKECHFFDKKFNYGIFWYKSHFPFQWEKEKNKVKVLSGESTPYYLYHPLAPVRVAQTLAGKKFICILRNPIDRAVSNFNHRFRAGHEKFTLEEAFEKEQQRIAGEVEKLIQDTYYISYSHYNYSYLTRGIYADQLERWFTHIPKQDIIILNSERFFEDPKSHFKIVLQRLGLAPYDEINFKVFNSGNVSEYYKMDDRLRNKLIEFYKPHNQRLYKLIGEEYDWDQ